MFNSLDKKIDKLKEFFIQKYTARLNALVCSKGIQCLSCGDKNVNYPDKTQYLQGSDGNMYYFKSKRFLYPNPVQMKENDGISYFLNNDTKKSRIPSTNRQSLNPDPKTAKKNFRLMSAKTNISKHLQNSNSLLRQQHVQASQVFSRNHLVKEHDMKCHNPVEDFKFRRKFQKKQRPLSSVPKFRVKH